MGKLISKRYSVALFELAKDTDKIDTIEEEINLLYNTIKNDSELEKVITHPRIGSDEKISLFESIYKDNISNEVLGLIAIATKKHREENLLEIFEEFLALVKAHKGIVDAYIQSATKLSDEQIENIKEKLSKKLNKKIVIRAEVSTELIGGLLINVDGKVIDNSIKKELSNIKKTLINN